MCFRSPRRTAIRHALLMLAVMLPGQGYGRVLRVCADPNNLPFSNQAEQGFENRIAELLARQLGATLEYTWWSERKGFTKPCLDERRCDLVIGVPTDLPGILATNPYYRSTYVFVSRKNSGLQLSSLSDPRLAHWRLGTHVVGEDYAPPAHALARRGVSNLVGYSLFGAFGEPNPASNIMGAVARGEIDVAIVWGPFAGYFASKQNVPLAVVPVSPETFLGIPFTYSISAAVRTGETQLKTELDRALEQDCAAVQAILAEYGVPQISEGRRQCASAPQSASASSH